MSDDKLHDAIMLGDKAAALLADDTLNKAFAAVEQAVFEKWKTSTDALERDRCWMAVGVGTQVRHLLGVFVMNGKIAQSDVNEALAKLAKAA